MRFTKMHGAGNDYVYVNAWEEPLPEDVPARARTISHRHTGVGSDGLISIGPASDEQDEGCGDSVASGLDIPSERRSLARKSGSCIVINYSILGSRKRSLPSLTVRLIDLHQRRAGLANTQYF